MASYTYVKRQRAKAKKWSVNCNASKARKRLANCEREEDEFERCRRSDVLLKTILIQDGRTGDAHRITVWNGMGARLNQVSVHIDGKRWKSLGITRLGKVMAKILTK